MLTPNSAQTVSGEEGLHYCLSCACLIGGDQAQTAIKGKSRATPTQYVHTNWKDCQTALRGLEKVLWPSPLAKDGLP